MHITNYVCIKDYQFHVAEGIEIIWIFFRNVETGCLF